MARIGAPPLSLDQAQRTIDTIHECLAEGFRPDSFGSNPTAQSEAANRLGIAHQTMSSRLASAKRVYGMEVDRSHYVERTKPAPFTIEGLPHDGEPTAEELIHHLKARHAQRKTHHDAAKLRQVQVHVDGPIAVAFFGDPHVDDSGAAWGDLERDIAICRDTPGVFAVNVGDSRNNWVGRLMGLYAHQEVTAKQTLVLIEWLFTQIPWLLTVGGNHDKWGSEHGDAAQIMHAMRALPGLYEDDGARIRMMLPSGADFTMHVRHDFPGHSIFNGAHALVRETLFGYRDHILACGHRHSTAYLPIWHNDPVRLCHGFRCGSYKDMDSFAKTKHFKDENWARAMGAVVDPELAGNPVRFVKPFFDLEEMAEYLTWRREKWSLGKTAA